MIEFKKFSNRISFHFNIVFVVVMVLVVGTILMIVNHYLSEEALDKLLYLSQSYANKIDIRFSEVKNTVIHLNSVIKNNFDMSEFEKRDMEYISEFEESFKDIIKDMTENIKDTRTIYFYFNPDYFNMHYNVSYAFLDSDEVTRLRILPATSYIPTDPEMQWFYEPMKEKEGVWSLPYYWEMFRTEIVTYSEPVIKNGEIIGVIGLDFDFTDLNSMISELKVYENGYAYLLNEDFRFIVHPYLTVYDNLRNVEGLDSERIIRILSEYSTGKSTYNYVGDNKLFGFTKLMNGWILGVSVPQTDLMNAMYEILTIISILSVASVILFIIISFYIGKSLTKPVKEISGRIKNFKEENLNLRIPEKGEAEFVNIIRSFNSMADELQLSFDTLKKNREKLRESKETIEDNNKELEASYKQIEYLANGLTRIFTIVSKISKSATENDESLLNDILYSLMSLVSGADYGTISIFEKDNWNFVYSVGHDVEKLRDIKISKKLPYLNENTFIVYKENSKGLFWPEEVFDGIESSELREVFLPVKSSIISFLKIGGTYAGCLSVDISENSNAIFGEEDTKIVSAFSNLASSFLTMKKYLISQEKFQKDIILSMIKLIELYDPYTRGHSEVVASISSMLGRKIGLSSEEINSLYWAGLVHDIGKILIPPSILTKPSSLSKEEHDIVKRHPALGAEVLKASEELQDISIIVLHHHERWDGNGYPYGIKGEEIPLYSRIVSIADSLDAMMSDRPYRDAMSLDEALKELRRCAGTQFDPYLVDLIESNELYEELINKIHKLY